MAKSSEKHKMAVKRWNKNNPSRRSYLSMRSTARSFIRNNATQEDLHELKALIASFIKN